MATQATRILIWILAIPVAAGLFTVLSAVSVYFISGSIERVSIVFQGIGLSVFIAGLVVAFTCVIVLLLVYLILGRSFPWLFKLTPFTILSVVTFIFLAFVQGGPTARPDALILCWALTGAIVGLMLYEWRPRITGDGSGQKTAK